MLTNSDVCLPGESAKASFATPDNSSLSYIAPSCTKTTARIILNRSKVKWRPLKLVLRKHILSMRV